MLIYALSTTWIKEFSFISIAFSKSHSNTLLFWILINAFQTPPPLVGDNVIVSAVVYPVPGFVIVIDVIEPPTTLAVAVAFTSELPGGWGENDIIGGDPDE